MSNHPIFSKDPNDWINLVHCNVAIETKDGDVQTGYVYTVDPVSESLVLVDNFDKDTTLTSDISLKIIMRDSVVNINVIQNADDKIKNCFNRLFREQSHIELSPEELEHRKCRLKTWLEKNRIPVTMSSDDEQSLRISDALIIRPPYTEHNCLSTNEIILLRVQGLIKNMPVSF